MPYKRYSRKFTRRPYKKTYTKKRYTARRSRLSTIVRRIALRQAEPKCKYTAHSKTELYHNAPYTILLNDPARMPAQGVTDSERVGDMINMSGIRLRMLLGQKGDRPNVNFRWWLLKGPKGSSYSYSDWFISTTVNVMLDDINTDYLKVLKTGYWRPNEAGLTASGNDEYTFVKKITLPYKKLVKFGPAGSAVSHNDSDIWFLLCAYDAYGSTGADNIAYIQVAEDLYYKDP